MAHKFKQVIYAGQKLVDESGGGGGNYQEKSVSFTPTESQQTEQVTPGSGYDALSKVNVTVGAIASDYVGTSVPKQAATTITPSTSQQTAVSEGKYTTGDVVVDPIPDEYIIPTGKKTITENGSDIDVAAFESVDVNVSVGGTDTLTERLNNTLTSFTYTGTADLPQALFYGCTSLVSVSCPNVTQIGIGNGANTNFGQFRGCTNLESVYFPELVSIVDGGAFYGCGKLSTAIFPKLTTIKGGNVFQEGGGNRTYVFPALSSLTGTDCLRSIGTAVLDFGSNFASLPERTFYMATYSTIIFRNSTQVVTATNSNSIQGINQNTTIYIPKALYDHLGDESALDYRAATNWAAKTTTTFACIEGSQYENYYADGTPIPTT